MNSRWSGEPSMHVVRAACIRLSLIASPRNLAASNGRCKQAVFKVVQILLL
jgi:hypothetical protein